MTSPLSCLAFFIGSLILEFAGCWMALLPWGTEAGQLGQEHYGTRDRDGIYPDLFMLSFGIQLLHVLGKKWERGTLFF